MLVGRDGNQSMDKFISLVWQCLYLGSDLVFCVCRYRLFAQAYPELVSDQSGCSRGVDVATGSSKSVVLAFKDAWQFWRLFSLVCVFYIKFLVRICVLLTEMAQYFQVRNINRKCIALLMPHNKPSREFYAVCSVKLKFTVIFKLKKKVQHDVLSRILSEFQHLLCSFPFCFSDNDFSEFSAA